MDSMRALHAFATEKVDKGKNLAREADVTIRIFRFVFTMETEIAYFPRMSKDSR